VTNFAWLENNQLCFKPKLLPGLEVKARTGAKFDDDSKSWKMPYNVANIEILKRLYGPNNIEMSPQLQQLYALDWGYIHINALYPVTKLPQFLQDSLYPYQKKAVGRLYTDPTNATLLALSPGLGKTITAIAAALALDCKRVLIVVPKILIRNWLEETEKWTQGVVQITNCHKVGPVSEGWVVTNPDTIELPKPYDGSGTGKKALQRKEQIERQTAKNKAYCIPWDLVIVDESVLFKNSDALRSKGLMKIRQNTKYLWLLSGSPASKYYDDLYSQFHLLRPKEHTSYWRFVNNYCYTEETPWSKNPTIIGNRQDVEPRTEFKDIMFAQNQEEVLPDLPTYIEQVIDCDMTEKQQTCYDTMYEEFIAMLEEEGLELTARSKLAQLIRLQEIVSTPYTLGNEWPAESGKINTLIELMQLGNIPKPGIIWTHWRRTSEYLLAQLRKTFPDLRFEAINGSTKNRDELLLEFRQDKVDYIILGLQVGKFGLNLFNAHSATYLDRCWDADSWVQSLARIRRNGLKHRPLLTVLHTPSSIDEFIDDNLKGKLEGISKITNAELRQLLIGFHSK